MPKVESRFWRCLLRRDGEDAYMLMGLHVDDSVRYLYGIDIFNQHGKGVRNFLNDMQEQIENGESPADVSIDRDDVILHIVKPEMIDRIDVFTNHDWMQTVYVGENGCKCVEFFQQGIDARKDIAMEIARTLFETEPEFEQGPRQGRPTPTVPGRATTIYKPSFFQRLCGLPPSPPIESVQQPNPSHSIYS